MDGANPTHRGTALLGLQVWDGAPRTHSPHLIFRQIFITINLAWLCDIKIPHIDNLLLENRSRAPAGLSDPVSLCCRPADQMEKVTVVAHHTWYQTGHLCCCSARGGPLHFNKGSDRQWWVSKRGSGANGVHDKRGAHQQPPWNKVTNRFISLDIRGHVLLCPFTESKFTFFAFTHIH